LDVLAQQITTEVAMTAWDYKALYHLVRQSHCYRDLPESVFKNVVEMLCGRLSHSPLQALISRLTWDRVNDRLIARRGSRLVAVMNGGTLPDRGYFGVYLENSNIKVGEVEEEFVFESRVAEMFILGNSEWLIKQITADRIIYLRSTIQTGHSHFRIGHICTKPMAAFGPDVSSGIQRGPLQYYRKIGAHR
jgi:ATP-dependent Lhr-like helicase